MLVYPSLDYELNSQVRKHREANGLTQEEFAFLIGRDVADVIRYEDLTTADAYDFNHTNRYARVLHRVPTDFVFEESLPENDVKIKARKTKYNAKVTYRGERRIMVNGLICYFDIVASLITFVMVTVFFGNRKGCGFKIWFILLKILSLTGC